MGVKTGIAVVLVVAAVAGSAKDSHHHGHAAARASMTDSFIPYRDSYSRHGYAVAFLRADGMRATRCNVAFMVAWSGAEGGNWANDARYNPTNTTEREPGSWSINSVGVQAYTSWHQGLAAEVATIRNGRYGAIQSALEAGNDAQRAADAVADSPWGTGPFAASC